MVTIIIFVVNEYSIMYYVDICYLIIGNLTNSSLSLLPIGQYYFSIRVEETEA